MSTGDAWSIVSIRSRPLFYKVVKQLAEGFYIL
jgi:hypothetical protein